MQEKQIVAIWLHDAAAKLLLGLRGERPVSRWAVVGTVMDPTPIGVWVDVSRIEERQPGAQGEGAYNGPKIVWTVKPGQCLIRWDYMIMAQRLKDKETPPDPRPTPGQYL